MPARRSIAFLLLAVLNLPPVTADAAVTLWQRKLVLQDKLSSRKGRATELMFFDRKGGEFSVEIDNKTRRIVSFSGVFRGLSRPAFKVLKTRVDSLRGATGIKAARVMEITYPRNGRRDLVMRLDLSDVGTWLTRKNYWSLMDAQHVSFRLNVKKIEREVLGLSVALEFLEGGILKEMKLLNWVRI